MKPDLKIQTGEYALHRFSPDSVIPPEVLNATFYCIGRTDEELSIVCPAGLALQSQRSEPGWRCIKVAGPLDFSLTGIMAGLSNTLSAAGISIFAISTFDTDYLLVKSDRFEQALSALQKAGYSFLEAPDGCGSDDTER